MLLTVSQGAIAGIAGGIAVGFAARAAMRIVALGIPDGIMQVPTFTIAGTLFILAIGAIVGAPLGVLFALAHPSLPGPYRFRGVLFGLILLATLGPLFFVGAADEFVSAGRIALFTALFLIFGSAVRLALPPSRTFARSLPAGVRTLPVAVAVGGAGLVLFGIVSLTLNAIGAHGLNTAALFASWVVVAAFAHFSPRWRIAPMGAAE